MSQREVNALVRLLGRLSTNGAQQPARSSSKRGRRGRRGRRAGNGAANPGTPMGQPGMPASTNPRRQSTRVVGDEGRMRVARNELLATVSTGDTGNASLTLLVDPVRSKDNFGWLSGLASSWERIVWHSLRISWRSNVGTMTDGSVAYGFDFNSPNNSKTAPSRAEVVSFTPVADHPVWQSTDARTLACPGGMLRSRAQFIMGAADNNDAAPCSICLNVNGGPRSKTVGEIWIRYDVTMSGPRKAST